jgi:heat shock protein HtpX
MNSAYSQQSSNIRRTWILVLAFIGLVSAVCFTFALYFDNYLIAIHGIALSLGQAFTAYSFGHKIALNTARAKEVTPEEAPQIHNIVDNLSKIAGIPKPRIFISPDPSPNAFATGRNPENASICLNQGILNLLNKQELEGVLAHELSHIKNRDILVMTMTMVLASVITIITDIGFRLALFGGGSKDNDNKSPIILILYFVAILLAPFVAILIQLAVSRSREYLADASAVVITRYPEGLISALEKLYQSPTVSTTYATSMQHFYISPPKQKEGGMQANGKPKSQSFLSTHPSLDDRIAALKKM